MFTFSNRKLLIAGAVIAACVLGGVAFVVYQVRYGTGVAPETETVLVLPPSSSLSMQEAQKQFKAIQDQVNAGTLSFEEAKKQMNVISSKNAPPELSPEANKYFEEMQVTNGSQPTPPPSSLSIEETQKQFKSIQDQVRAGTLSFEEAAVQMNALGFSAVPLVHPPEAPK